MAMMDILLSRKKELLDELAEIDMFLSISSRGNGDPPSGPILQNITQTQNGKQPTNEESQAGKANGFAASGGSFGDPVRDIGSVTVGSGQSKEKTVFIQRKHGQDIWEGIS